MEAANVRKLPIGSPMPPSISVRFEKVYGLLKCYPSCPMSEAIARIARTKTLSPANLADARALGFDVIVDNQSLELLNTFLAGSA